MSVLEIAKNVITLESQEIAGLVHGLTEDFTLAVDAILKMSGKLIVSGMGKSGLIGQKIAATLASTGTPSFFLHPAEAYHGDLGMVGEGDIVLLISRSGETDEILRLIPFLQSQKNLVISMTGKSLSTLARHSHFHISIAIEHEACPLQLAPTSSTTATLVMGDALAVSLMNKKAFEDVDFAKFHPGGSLGKRLLTKVKDVMRVDHLPRCSVHASLIEVIHIISIGESGLVVIEEEITQKILGIITDGDLRRAMETYQKDFFDLSILTLMNKTPKMIHENERIAYAQDVMNQYHLNALIVVDASWQFVGILKQYHLGF